MNDALSFARARSPTQKRARETEVLDAAARLLATQPFASISLSDLAAEVSFSRANLYKYFGSREEVYLALMARSVERFGLHLSASLAEDRTSQRAVSGTREAAESFAEFWIDAIRGQRELLSLLSMAGTVLETGCGDGALLDAKRRMAAALSRHLVPTVTHFFPALGEEGSVALVRFLMVTANGLFPMCGLDGRQQELLRAHGLSVLVLEFEPVYGRIVREHLASLDLGE